MGAIERDITVTGGNTLDKAPTGPVSDFVKQNGGHTVITKVSALRMPARWGVDAMLALCLRMSALDGRNGHQMPSARRAGHGIRACDRGVRTDIAAYFARLQSTPAL